MTVSIREICKHRFGLLVDGKSLDPLLELDIAHNATIPLTTKLVQTLDLMSFGFELQCQTFANHNPTASEDATDRLFNAWLARDD